MRGRRSPRRKTILRAAVAGLLTSISLWSANPTGAAPVYEITASAHGVYVYGANEALLPLGAYAEGGLPSAQVEVKNGPLSHGFAAAPYPGYLLFSAIGLAGTRVGAPLRYPAYVNSNNSTQSEATFGGPGATLEARSDDYRSEATGQAGVGDDAGSMGVVRSSAVAAYEPENGTATASAAAVVEAVTFGEVLRIGRIVSSVSLSKQPGTPLQREVELVVEGISVGGQAVALTPEGLVVGSTGTPIGETPLGEVLEEQGVSLEYLAATENPDGAVSGGLQVRFNRALPNAGTTDIVYTFGRTAAHIHTDSELLQDDPLALPTGGDNAGQRPTGAMSVDEQEYAGSEAMATVPDSSRGNESFGGEAAAGTAEGISRTGTAPSLNGVPAAQAREMSTFGFYFYLPLVGAAVAMFGSAQLLRLLGVRG